MRRLLVTLTVLLTCVLGLPALAAAAPAPAPLGGGSVLFALDTGARCTAAFAAVSGTTGHLVTGPGCTGAGTQFYSGDNVLVGPLIGSSATHGAVRVTNTAAWQLVPWIPVAGGRHYLRGSAEAPVGGTVCLIDRTTGLRCGTVVAKNQTVNYPGGTIYGLTRTNVCMEPGGSPIAFVSGDQAQGVPLGGSGNCSTGGTSYFQPINPILAGYGLRLLTG